MGKRDLDADVKQIMRKVDARIARDEKAITAARALPVTPGRCPGSGLRTRSAGGYDVTVCAVCWKVLGPWDWNNTFPLATKHDRKLDD